MNSSVGQRQVRVAENDSLCTLLLSVAVAASLLPFVGKAFHIDDTLFLMAARQIRHDPLDFYGCDVNWYGTTMRMADVTKNPPLTCYFLACVAGLAGWSEPLLHAAMLVPAAAAVIGTWRLALHWTRARESAVVAALATLASPAFLISSTTVMCDTMMLAFFIWAIVLWEQGLRNDDPRWLVGAGLLAAACGLTKYFGVALIPLLFIHGLVFRRRAGWWLAALLLPIAALVGYQLWTKQLYGQGLLSDAADYATNTRALSGEHSLQQLLTGLTFTGGCCLPALCCLPWLWGPRAVAGWGVLAAAVGLIFNAVFPGSKQADWSLMVVAAQGGLFASAGAATLAMAAADCRRRSDMASMLLLLWVVGTFVFATAVNWTVNGRSVLPLVPAVAILLARRLEDHSLASRVTVALFPDAHRVTPALPLAVSLVVSLVMAHADSSHADSARKAAAMVRDRAAARPHGRTWFQGHWGFQHYMEAWGALPLDFENPVIHPGDLLVIPANNTNCELVNGRQFVTFEEFSLPLCSWASVFQYSSRTGFYGSGWGPLPFGFGPTMPEIYQILEFTGDLTEASPAVHESNEEPATMRTDLH